MDRALICFTRVPRAGQAKTRLMPLLGAENCAALQWAFLRDLAEVYQSVSADLFVAFTPDPEWEELKRVFPHAKGFFPQEGQDLGARMDHAIRTVLNLGYDACVLTGSDLPLMTADHLESGFCALAGADVTLGPTSDGGYYLVGMKKPCPEVFQKQTYGHGTVFENTAAAAKEAGYTVLNAMPCEDVDTPEDLKTLYCRIASSNTHTARFLAELKQAGIDL